MVFFLSRTGKEAIIGLSLLCNEMFETWQTQSKRRGETLPVAESSQELKAVLEGLQHIANYANVSLDEV